LQVFFLHIVIRSNAFIAATKRTKAFAKWQVQVQADLPIFIELLGK
jgi:hypothetical protein